MMCFHHFPISSRGRQHPPGCRNAAGGGLQVIDQLAGKLHGKVLALAGSQAVQGVLRWPAVGRCRASPTTSAPEPKLIDWRITMRAVNLEMVRISYCIYHHLSSNQKKQKQQKDKTQHSASDPSPWGVQSCFFCFFLFFGFLFFWFFWFFGFLVSWFFVFLFFWFVCG